MHSSGTLHRVFAATGPRIAGAGFALASVHEGPPIAVTDEERGLARTMRQPRRADFLIGRSALHRAVRAAGLRAGSVLCDGPRPRLPEGLSGSISHSNGVAVALAGPADRFPLLGIDLELSRLPVRAAHLVLHETEMPLLAPDRETTAAPDREATAPPDREVAAPPGRAAPAGAAPVCAGPGAAAGRSGAPERRLLALYSAKEAAFKALSPVLGPALRGLRDLRLTPDARGFLARAAGSRGPVVRVSVRQLPRGGVLCWALAREAAPAPVAPAPTAALE